MKGTLVTISPDGTQTVEHVDTARIIDKLSKAVGGYIETVPYFEKFETAEGAVRCAAFCNEEGKINGLHMNHYAQARWKWAHASAAAQDYLCGPVVVVYGDAEFMREL